MFSWSWRKLWILSFIVLVLTACPSQEGSFTLSVREAVQGESVTANLEGLDGNAAKVTVAGLNAEITSSTDTSVTFTIPDGVPEGEQDVLITSGDKIARGKITILSGLAPSFTLNPSQASPGDDVTATLSNLEGTTATVTVAGTTATVKSKTPTSLIFTVPDVAEGPQEVVIRSGDKEAKGSLTIVIVDGTFALDRKNAARAETVGATTTDVDLSRTTLKVAGQEVTFTVTGENSFTFAVPGNAPAGPQTVTLQTPGGNLNQSLEIWGDIIPDKLSLLLKPETTQGELLESLERLGFGLEQYRVLGASEGPCASAFAEIDVNGRPLGEALEELEKEGIALYIDPRSGYSSGSVDHLGAVGASVARANGFTGAGTIIAILDTGVNPHPELTDRPFISPFNAIDGSDNVTDAYNLDSDGHGTPIAVLAAGSASGVAPGASIMPVKTCNELGECFSSDVIVSVCHVLTEAPDLSKLILNLSLGGDTPVDALQAILNYALEQGVQVAVAAGNEGEFGSPIHYPAAFDLPGLVAVGALEASSLQCVDFDEQATGGRYVIGSTLSDTTINISFKEFFFVSQGSTTSGFASVAGTGPNKTLSTNNINAQFAFAYPVDAISFLYVDQGGSENLEINGDLRAVGNLNDLDGETVGGVSVSVELLQFEPVFIGEVRLEGDITQFAVGGQEFLLDNVCPSKASAWGPAVFSTRGDYVDISAPGVALRSGTPSGAYADDYEGTSFSTPLVAGAMALWKEADETLSPVQIEANLKRDALPLSFTPNEVGAGLLNLNVAPFNVPPPVTLRANSQ
jgi:subtilisin